MGGGGGGGGGRGMYTSNDKIFLCIISIIKQFVNCMCTRGKITIFSMAENNFKYEIIFT